MTKSQSCIALVAHDNKKAELVEWVKQHRDMLSNYELCATGTTGTLVEDQLGLSVRKFEVDPWVAINKSGPGLPKGRLISSFSSGTHWPHPHDPDVEALLRIAVVWNIPFACNHTSADFMIASPLMSTEYQRQPPNFDSYRQRLKT